MTEDAPKSEPGKQSLRAQLLRGGVAGFFLRAGSILASLLLTVTLARVLGPENYGVYVFVFSLITVLSLPVKMGLPTLILRETARADQAGDGALMFGIWRWSDQAMCVMNFGILLAVVVYLLFADYPADSTRISSLLWALPLIPLIAFAEAKSAAVRGLRWLFLGGAPDKIVRPVLLSGAVLFLYPLSPIQFDAKQVYILHAFVAGLTLGLIWWILARIKPSISGFETPSRRTRSWIAAILPLAAIAGLQMVSHNTDILMLGWLASDKEVGIYRVAWSGANIALFGLITANLVLQPYFARAWQAGDASRMQKLATVGARLSTATALPVLIVFWLGGTWLLTLVFGDEYTGAFYALMVLCLSQTVSALFGSVGNLLTMAGREKVALAGLALSTTVNVALNWFLIPLYGIEGAALATGISIAVWNVLLWIAAWSLMGIDSSLLGLRGSTKPLTRPGGDKT